MYLSMKLSQIEQLLLDLKSWNNPLTTPKLTEILEKVDFVSSPIIALERNDKPVKVCVTIRTINSNKVLVFRKSEKTNKILCATKYAESLGERGIYTLFVDVMNILKIQFGENINERVDCPNIQLKGISEFKDCMCIFFMVIIKDEDENTFIRNYVRKGITFENIEDILPKELNIISRYILPKLPIVKEKEEIV